MLPKFFYSRSIVSENTSGLRLILLSGLILINLTRAASAQNLTWDASGSHPTAATDGSGTWNFSSAHWSNGTTDGNWITGSTAVFGDHDGAAGTITLGVPITAGGITFNTPGSGTYTIAGTGTNTLTLTGVTPRISFSNSATISAVIAGTNGLTISGGPGTLTLSGSNTYTGGTTLQGGTVSLGSSGALGTTGTISFGSGILQFTSSNTTDYSNRISNASLQNFAFDTNGQSVTLAGNLTSSGGDLNKYGSGILTLTGTNNYTAGTDLHGGELSLGSSGAIPTASPISFSGGSLQFTSANTTDYSSSFGTFSGQQYSIDTNGQSVTFASNLTSSGGSLNKFGAGTLTLKGTNTYSGGTTVGGGALLANGSNSTGTGAVAVNNGGTLGGNGTIAPSGVSSGNAVTIAFGGALNQSMVTGGLGTSTLTLALHSGSTVNLLSSNVTLAFDLGANGVNDRVDITGGTLTLHSQNFSNFNFTTLSGFTGVGTYNLFVTDSPGDITGSLGITTGSIGAYMATLSVVNSQDVVLTVGSVPEPSTWTMLIGGLGLLAFWHFRTRRPQVTKRL